MRTQRWSPVVTRCQEQPAPLACLLWGLPPRVSRRQGPAPCTRRKNRRLRESRAKVPCGARAASGAPLEDHTQFTPSLATRWPCLRGPCRSYTSTGCGGQSRPQGRLSPEAALWMTGCMHGGCPETARSQREGRGLVRTGCGPLGPRFR